MEKLFRFSDYDVLAYITSGVLALAIVDALLPTHFLVGAKWTVSEGVLTILGCYVLGQLIATPSAALFEGLLVKRVLGRPSDLLIKTVPEPDDRNFVARTLLRNYFTPLEPAICGRLRDIMEKGALKNGEALFWCAFPEVKTEPITYGRMSTFLNLYGFARNIAFVLLIGGIGLFIARATLSPQQPGPDYRMWLGLLALIGALGMIHRYLKFYRLYSVEVLTSFDALRRAQK